MTMTMKKTIQRARSTRRSVSIPPKKKPPTSPPPPQRARLVVVVVLLLLFVSSPSSSSLSSSLLCPPRSFVFVWPQKRLALRQSVFGASSSSSSPSSSPSSSSPSSFLALSSKFPFPRKHLSAPREETPRRQTDSLQTHHARESRVVVKPLSLSLSLSLCVCVCVCVCSFFRCFRFLSIGNNQFFLMT